MTDLFALHACCRERIAPAPKVYAVPVGTSAEFPDCGPPLPLPPVELIRDRRIAVHESTHGVVQVALGGTVASVTIDGQPHMRAETKLSYPRHVLVVMAGPAGERWRVSEIEPMPDGLLRHWIAETRRLAGGSCDQCQSVRHCLVELSRDGKGGWKPPVPDEIVVSEYRRLENLAGAIVRLPDVWTAINEIADALMEHGTLTGEDVHEMCARHFVPGFVLESVE